jgi:hypothetical protein
MGKPWSEAGCMTHAACSMRRPAACGMRPAARDRGRGWQGVARFESPPQRSESRSRVGVSQSVGDTPQQGHTHRDACRHSAQGCEDNVGITRAIQDNVGIGQTWRLEAGSSHKSCHRSGSSCSSPSIDLSFSTISAWVPRRHVAVTGHWSGPGPGPGPGPQIGHMPIRLWAI